MVLQSLPGVLDSMSEPVEVVGVETALYLDDSGSMVGSGIDEGCAALRAISPLLRGMTRVIKFGSAPTLLAPRDVGVSDSLVQMAWDGSSGGTYMWHMIEQDVRTRYRPGSGKLRLIVVTDGQDTLSPGEYNGVRGMDPMMRTLTGAGYDVEWHIIVLGNVPDSQRYRSLATATGGSFLAVDTWGGASGKSALLAALDDDDDDARRERRRGYERDATAGKASKFGWYKALPPT